ncbi:UNKNOWN [Stylonychia lemnae]|uniref:Uncharacterized protein n=1 Tax=Stylonychia lemnae TaxID=5949 RepID=A0A078AQN0_STYLE|nr:UNKNOWN [Stylonychia lemnae]|eukprot:CDW84745.1 UNKNOWN [Stylonychia lemnae]
MNDEQQLSNKNTDRKQQHSNNHNYNQNNPLSDSSYSRESNDNIIEDQQIISQESRSRTSSENRIEIEDCQNYSYQKNRILDTEDNQQFLQSSLKSDLNCLKYISQQEDLEGEYQEEPELEEQRNDGYNLVMNLSQKQYFSEASLSPEKPVITENLSAAKQLQFNQSKKDELEDIFKNSNLFVGCIVRAPKKEMINKEQTQRTGRHQQPSGMGSRSSSFVQKQKSQLDLRCLEAKEVKQRYTNLFTTQKQSRYLFNSKAYVHKDVLKQILPNQKSIPYFMTLNDNPSDFKTFLYDTCINEDQGHNIRGLTKQINNFFHNEQKTQNLNQQINNYSNLDNEKANDLFFLFGQNSSFKSDLFNPIDPDSLISKCVSELKDPIKFLRVSMFYLDLEYTLIQKSYQGQTNSQVNQEFWYDLRQSQRTRQSIVKKIITNKQIDNTKDNIKYGSHLIIQVNNLIFIDLGGIECLNQSGSTLIVQNLTMNFSSVTNEILKLSQYYQNHRFQISEEQESSPFNQYLRQYISQESKVALLCSVSPKRELQQQTLIALDYCQKIKSYFNGISENDLQTHLAENIFKTQDELPIHQVEMGQLLLIINKVQMRLVKKNKMNSKKIQKYKLTLEKIQLKIDDVKGNIINVGEFDQCLINELHSQMTECYKLVKEQQGLQQQKSPINISNYQSNSRQAISATRQKSVLSQHSAYKSFRDSYVSSQQAKKSGKKGGRSTQRSKKQMQRSASRSIRQSISSNKLLSPLATDKLQPKEQEQLIEQAKINRNQNIQCQIIDKDESAYHQVISGNASPVDQIQQRDTPQFQDDQQFQSSSLYLKTSGVSSNYTSQKRLFSIGRIQDMNKFNSQFSSIIQPKGSLYCNTDQSIEVKEEVLLSNIAEFDKENDLNQTINVIQGKLKQALTENESLRNLKIIYEKQIQQFQNQSKASNANNSKNIDNKKQLKDSKQKIGDLQSQLKLKDQQILKLKEKQDKLIDTSKESKDLEIDKLKRELQQVKEDRDQKQNLNLAILQQIQVMKEVIEDFKEKEKEKTDLIEKLQQKDLKIKKLNDLITEMRNGMKSTKDIKYHDEKLQKLEKENRYLNETQNLKINEVETKFQNLFVDYKYSLDENKELKKKAESLEGLLRQTEKAKENFKDQTIDLKQEIRHLKNQLKENCENIEYMKQKAMDQQKSMVLGDIKNLIKDYKNEKKLNSSQK